MCPDQRLGTLRWDRGKWGRCAAWRCTLRGDSGSDSMMDLNGLRKGAHRKFARQSGGLGTTTVVPLGRALPRGEWRGWRSVSPSARSDLDAFPATQVCTLRGGEAGARDVAEPLRTR